MGNAVTKMKCLLGYFGLKYNVRQLTPSDVLQYIRQRRAGGSLRTDGKRSVPVGQRAVCEDLSLLRVMFRWACTVRTQGNYRWLDRNPLEGTRFVVQAVGTAVRGRIPVSATRPSADFCEG
jgi:hypothetical protein